MKDTMALIFAYQKDEPMKALTQKRSLSSVPYGGRYRIIDFALSNAVNSGITKVGIITRSHYQSLMDHVGSGKEWDLNRKRDGLFVLPPFSHMEGYQQGVYRGKMEALMNAEAFIRRSNHEYVILSTADSICNMTYNEALEFHKKKGADITILYKRGRYERENNEDSSCFIHVDENDRVTDVAVNPVVDRECLSMGQIIIGKTLLETLIWECNSYNAYSLHKDVLQKKIHDLKIYGYEYTGHYVRIDSIASYFQANMELLKDEVRNALFYQDHKIYTKIRDEIPTLYCREAQVKNSLVADGCIIEGTVENSIISRGVRIRKGAVVKNSIIMQSCEIQSGCQLDYTIADKDVVIRENRKLFGYEMYPMVLSKGSVV